MQITQIKQEELKHSYNVKMTAEEIDQRVTARLNEIGKDIKVPGFRPGRAPMSLLKSKYGKSVMGEVLEAVVNDCTAQAINENNLRPAMRPKIEVKTFDESAGLEYDMEIELLPEIKIADLSGLKLEKLVAHPAPAQVQETLDRIAKSSRKTEKLDEDRPAREGDIVVIDFDGTVNGEPFPGMKGNDFELELGSKSFVDTFEKQLEGVKAGGAKTVTVTFPEDYGHDKLRGVEAVFEVTVKEIRKGVSPAIDDEFAKGIGFDDLATLKDAIVKQMQGEYDQLARMNVKRHLLDALDEKHSFTVPAGMVEAEFDGIWHQIKGHHHDHDDPDHVHGPDCAHDHGTEEERAEYRKLAERRVKLGLVLAEIGRDNKIEVTNQELQQAVINEARRYPGQEREVFEYYQKNPQALDAVKAPVYEDKVVDFILEKASVSEREVTIEELTKATEDADQ